MALDELGKGELISSRDDAGNQLVIRLRGRRGPGWGSGGLFFGIQANGSFVVLAASRDSRRQTIRKPTPINNGMRPNVHGTPSS